MHLRCLRLQHAACLIVLLSSHLNTLTPCTRQRADDDRYWDIRGLAQAIRFALEFCGAPYADFRIDAGPPPSDPHYKADSYKERWFNVKEQVGTHVPFPNLPFYIDADVALSQSTAILRHVGRKFGCL